MKLSFLPAISTALALFVGAAAGQSSTSDFSDESRLALHPFLSYTASGQAMGNAVGSLPGHPSNPWVNPAGMAFREGLLIYGAPNDEVNDFLDDRDRSFSAMYRLSKSNAVGGGLIVRDRSIRLDRPVGKYDILEKALLLSYARRMGENWGAGLSVIGYQHSSDLDTLDGETAFAVTVGFLARSEIVLGDEFPVETRLGFSLANFGSTFDIGTREADLPLYSRIGYSMNYKKDHASQITVAADIYSVLRDKAADQAASADPDLETTNITDRLGWGVGVEAKLSGVVALRLGYLADDDVTPDGRSGGTFGFGVGHEILKGIGGMVEYARAPASPSDTADHIGVRFYMIPGRLTLE